MDINVESNPSSESLMKAIGALNKYITVLEDLVETLCKKIDTLEMQRKK